MKLILATKYVNIPEGGTCVRGSDRSSSLHVEDRAAGLTWV
jgi:hypothetical protein